MPITYPVEQFERLVDAGVPAAVVIRPIRPTLLLNIHQAQAVFSAMCALNNLGDVRGCVLLPGDSNFHPVTVQWDENSVLTTSNGHRESHTDQSAFSAAYGLDIPQGDIDLEQLADDAMNIACAHIQNRLGVTDGDMAGSYFSGLAGAGVRNILQRYIKYEIYLKC